ncbi:MAG: MopE-related protein [Kofleriaceae bacterium]|nr:MopE-related protein [Kofleriaceae bacterium]
MLARPLFAAFALSTLAILALAPGCSCGSVITACTRDSDCPVGNRCIDAMCRPNPTTDGGPVVNRDSGPQRVCRDDDGDRRNAISPTCSGSDDCDDSNPNVYTGAREICGDGLDNDCNGQTDEPGCSCQPGQSVACYSGPNATRGVGRCRGGIAQCGTTGVLTACMGETVPAPTEECNGLDDNCDGTVDEGVRNACGECSPTTPAETCDDGIDNDCDGQTDEDCFCDFQCQCQPMTSCTCAPPTNQPCYTGPFGTGGKGICRGGRRDCVDTGGGTLRWGTCNGQVTPAVECENGQRNNIDDDCDGVVDDGCIDGDGDGVPGPADCADTDPAIKPGAPETCNGIDDNCNGAVDEGVTNRCGGCGMPAASDTCGNGLDDDCDGTIDDGCTCAEGATQPCYGGPPATKDVAACRAGTQTCEPGEFGAWAACTGQVLPSVETCNGMDDDCDGETDERWAAGSNPCGFCVSAETCDGMDNNCDGRVDEGVSNACGTCGAVPAETCNGMDDDCDGAVDDGVTNACGTCPPMPCFTENWPMPWSDCMANPATCNGIEQGSTPGTITLGQRTFDANRIYIGVQGVNEVAAMDTDTGALLWSRPSYGLDPSRTTVAFDGTVWVGNRGLSGDANNPAVSNLVHLDFDGNFICRADITGIVRGVAIAANGDIWAGTWNDARIYRVSGTVVTGTGLAARCQILGNWAVRPQIGGGEGIYGLAIDGNQRVWTASVPNTVRFDIATSTPVGFANSARYGIAPDQSGNIWFGDWTNTAVGIHAYRPDGSSFLAGSSARAVTAVTFHPMHGTVWGTRYSDNEVVSIWGDPVKAGAAGRTVGQENCRVSIPGAGGQGANPHGVAVDRMGRLWTPMNTGGGWVNVWNTSCGRVATYRVDPRGNALYSYSDMTGAILRTITSNEGRWVQDFDSGYARANWYRVTWNATTPAGTGVRVIVRSADTRAALTTAAACGGPTMFTSSPADISGCPGIAQHRWLRVEVVLSTSMTGVRPVVSAVDAAWAY